MKSNYPANNQWLKECAMSLKAMHEMSWKISKGLKSLWLVSLLILPALSTPATASVVSGDFSYVQEGDGSLVQYHVNQVDFRGQRAWRIAWECEQLTAEHFVSLDGVMPLYTKRTNHALKRTIEITYSQSDKQPTLYRKQSENELVERKIWDTGLRDLGVLPQLLLAYAQQKSHEDIRFKAINYEDGSVYPFVASRSGFKHIRTETENEKVRCTIYDVKLDSWLSTFIGKTRLLIPVQQQRSNFVSYSGPALDGVADSWSLRLIGRGRTVAMLE